MLQIAPVLEKAHLGFLSLVWLIEESLRKRKREGWKVEEGKRREGGGRERKGGEGRGGEDQGEEQVHPFARTGA